MGEDDAGFWVSDKGPLCANEPTKIHGAIKNNMKPNVTVSTTPFKCCFVILGNF